MKSEKNSALENNFCTVAEGEIFAKFLQSESKFSFPEVDPAWCRPASRPIRSPHFAFCGQKHRPSPKASEMVSRSDISPPPSPFSPKFSSFPAPSPLPLFPFSPPSPFFFLLSFSSLFSPSSFFPLPLLFPLSFFPPLPPFFSFFLFPQAPRFPNQSRSVVDFVDTRV